MSKTVVDQLLASGEVELGGTGRDVSVLFSDIRGFTSISERLGAKETVALLNEYFTDMVDIVFAHNGVLDKYIGDMIMAVFGSVLQSEEDASNAVTVGNRMMTALHALNHRRTARSEEPIRIGVGISTGNVGERPTESQGRGRQGGSRPDHAQQPAHGHRAGQCAQGRASRA